MKKVFVVSKTHLDLGFTDFAETIRQTYINTYIPNAILLAEQLNTPQQKRFIWTTGSWLLKEALKHGAPEQQARLRSAIQRGDIVPHAMPFTTHTELLDEDTLEYGLSIVDSIDALRGRKTIAAKMTDVPGHTRGLLESLARRHGIKLLHLGVNGASALAEVPPCFVWKSGKAEIVVIYSGDYGGAFQSELLEEVLYFDHTLDNHGTPSDKKILKKLKMIEKQFPGYQVEAGCMDDFAEILWEQRSKLPVVTMEIGDTWIHGSASDPYKSAALRELMRLKRKWLETGTMTKGSTEHAAFTDKLLCIAEHTCGMDMKHYFADYEHYLKPDFQAARTADRVKMRHPLRDFPQNLYIFSARTFGDYQQGSYQTIEASWAEQRGYIDGACSALSPAHGREAKAALAWLLPAQPFSCENHYELASPLECGKWRLEVNRFGGIGRLSYDGDDVIRENNAPAVEYHSYCEKDYDYWLTHYTRDLKQTASWAVGDFARPLLKYAAGKYPVGRFPYQLENAYQIEAEAGSLAVCLDLKCASKLCEQLGAPRLVQILYRLSPEGLRMDVSWFGKDANRLTEAIYLHLFPAHGSFRLRKIKDWVLPDEVVSMGGRNLHAVMFANLHTANRSYSIINRHAPLISPGGGKILEFDNRTEDIDKKGVTYVLYNNVWGTNFPLWYEDNARFRFLITRNTTDVERQNAMKSTL